MNTVKNAARALGKQLRWWDWLVIGINLFFAVVQAVAGYYAVATNGLVIAVLYGGFIYFLNLSTEQYIEIQHLRRALRGTVKADSVAAVESAELRWREAKQRHLEVLKSAYPSKEAVWDAQREAQVAQFELDRARENAANELARMTQLLDDGGDR